MPHATSVVRMARTLSLCGLVAAGAAFNALRAQVNWAADPQNVTRANLWGVGYANNIVIAVGERGAILRFDYEEPAWQSAAAPSDAWLLSVAEGNGHWVVVGDQGTILVSTDEGRTWETRRSGTTVRLNAVAYGNGRWLAVGEQGVALTSADTETWTTRPSLGTGFLRALAFGHGQFLVGGARGTLYSTTDAATFTRITIDTTADIEAAAVGATRFFLSGSRGLLGVASESGSWQLTPSSPDTLTFRGLVARGDDASAVGDGAAYGYSSGWFRGALRPEFLATSATVARGEAIAVGFDGGIARSNSLFAVTIVPAAAVNVIYGGELRLRAVPAGTATAVSYQWRRDGANLPGMTQADLLVRGVGPTNAGAYTVAATSGATALLASSVRVNVMPGGRPAVVDRSFNYDFTEVPSSIFPLPDNKVYVNHQVVVDGVSRFTITRLNADGSIDATFRPAVVDVKEVLALYRVLPDGRLVVNGVFTGTGGAPERRYELLEPNGAIDVAFRANRPADVVLSTLTPATSDRFFAQTDAGIVRLLGDGRVDSSFTPVKGASILTADSLGRLLTVTRTFPPLTPGIPSNTLFILTKVQRYLADGALDATFSASYTEPFSRNIIGNWNELYAVRGDWLFSQGFSIGKIYGSSGVGGFDSKNPAVTVSPPGRVATEVAWWFPLANGHIWDFRAYGDYSSGRPLYGCTVRDYAPQTGLNAASYATMPDFTDYLPLAAAVDGTLYAMTNRYIASATPLPKLVRIRPLHGRVGRLTNLSVRAQVTPAEPLIVGFVTTGSGTTRALVRAIGPGLASFGVADAARDPLLTLQRDGTAIATNDNWDAAVGARFASVGAFPLASGSRDAALESEIGAGNHTAILTVPSGDGGTGLIELFEASGVSGPSRQFTNVSARGPVGPNQPLFVGFTVTGETPAQVLIRGVGPALARLGVTNALSDPALKLYRDATALWENDDWDNGRPIGSLFGSEPETIAAANAVGAFALVSPVPTSGAPYPSSRDAAMLVTLAPGNYTAQVTASGTALPNAGVALIEVYSVP